MKKKYNSYKDSGVEWIGEIPVHWDKKKIKYVTSILTGSTPKSNVERYWNGNIYWVTTEDLGKLKSKEISDTRRKITVDGFNNCGTNLAPVGSIVMSTRAPIGHLGILRIEACSNQGCKTIVANNIYKSEFLYYFLHTRKEYLNSLGSGTTFLELPTQSLKDFYVPFPEKNEQQQIVAYLDRKTTLIDDLIQKKKRKIELLFEKRTALINHAVTKGLNPDVEMKDSGVEWIGEVPVHWIIKKLKFTGSVKYGLGQPPKEKEDGLPIIRATNIFRGKIEDKNMMYVDPDDLPYDRNPILKEGDIIVVRSGAYTADSAIITSKYDGAVSGYDMVFRNNTSVKSKFISYCLLSNYVLNNQLLLKSLRAAQPHLNREELCDTILLVPELQEQQQIVDFLDEQAGIIDATIEKEQQKIELLKEYRQSLISEVVTGKIKVTN
jgi:type I restriction enzyme, S subunit